MDERQQSREEPIDFGETVFPAALPVLTLDPIEGYENYRRRWRRRYLVGGIVAVLTILILIGYRYGITLWNWLDLLIVPAVLAGGGIWFNMQQREREQKIAEQKAQHEALQAYLEEISKLLTDKERPLHRAEPSDDLSVVARARTLTVLVRLDSIPQGFVIGFLYASGLLYKERLVLDLWGVNLFGADLSGYELKSANLWGANLREADLREADLSSANLWKANLGKANLSGAKLWMANLGDADLEGAVLQGAEGVTMEQLASCNRLESATMPNGQGYEDWIETAEGQIWFNKYKKDRLEKGQNSSPP